MTSAQVVPPAPAELSIGREDFLGPDFSPDRILTRLSNLETLREDLGIYLKILRSAVVRLIDEDYSDFVDLSSNLVGLDERISGISKPLAGLAERISEVLKELLETRESVLKSLRRKEEIRVRKSGLRNSERILNALSKLELMMGGTLSGDSEERIARDINHLHFCVSKCHDDGFVNDEIRPRLTAVGDRLKESLESRFLNALFSQSDSDKEVLKKCLRIYATVESIHEAEILVRSKIISPALEHILTEDSLNSDPLGLKGVYSRVLGVISSTLEPLLKLTMVRGTGNNAAIVIQGYDFLIHSFWTDFVDKTEDNLSFVFAAGNPEAFFMNYRTSMEFLKDFGKELGDGGKIRKFRSETSYNAFVSRWNLPVYFQIRFQEIGLPLERALADIFQPAEEGETVFRLKAFSVVMSSLKRVWSPDIFIGALLHRSWKLTLQILSRTGTALEETAVLPEDENDRPMLKSLVCLWYDTRDLTHRFEPEVYKVDILPVLHDKVKDENLLLRLDDTIKESLENLRNRLSDLSSLVIDNVVSKSIKYLKQVSDIPRLYRRTNREVPSKPCSYMESVLAPVRQFSEVGAKESHWTMEIFSRITEQYCANVSEVLEAVLKMEESLKRLKRIREKSDTSATTPLTSADGKTKVSDNDKIRLQVKVDVDHFSNVISEEFGLSHSDVKKLEDLLSIVSQATKNIVSE